MTVDTFSLMAGSVITGGLTLEVLLWSKVFHEYANILRSDSHERRKSRRLNWTRLLLASIMNCAYGICMAAWWVSFTLVNHDDSPHGCPVMWIVASIQLSSVHWSAIVARCSGLRVEQWPWASRKVSAILQRWDLCDRFDKKEE